MTDASDGRILLPTWKTTYFGPQIIVTFPVNYNHIASSSFIYHLPITAVMAEQRAARLAAIEARLAGQAQSPATSSTNADTATITSMGAAAKPKEPTWQPTEKGDLEKKKEFTKLLYRGIVRDNGYREASGCVDVSQTSFLSLSLNTT
jgi:hypothetical protein